MNVLHINQSDIIGGAGIAGYRLHQGLLARDVDSYMLVGRNKLDDNRIARINGNRYIDGAMLLVGRLLGLNYLFLLRGINLNKHRMYQAADVINLHNLHNGYFNYLTLPRLAAKKPIVYTLHDMWSFTGHCAYSYDCNKWMTGCGGCPYPDIYPRINIDNSRIEWKLKHRIYTKSNITVVTPSRWLADLAAKSMLNGFTIHHIPNGLDIDVFHPIDQQQCRKQLNIPKSSNVILFAADNFSDPRKGWKQLLEAITGFSDSMKQKTVLLLFGKQGVSLGDIGMQTIELGYLEDDTAKAVAYSAADIFVFPSLADNLPLVLQESMACGTPMVAFNVGGIPELVRSGQTGFVADEGDVQDFRNKIVSLLSDNSMLASMSSKCRDIAVSEFGLQRQVESYLKLYEKILTEHGSIIS